MSIYTTPLGQLTSADLQDLVQEQAVESLRLEFKLEEPNKDETLKKLSAFANTYGGIMIVGARASSKDGRITDLPGVDEIPGFKQKVVDWCFKGVNPPLTPDVSDAIPIPSATGKFAYVIKIRESDVAPHFLNGRKGVWIRTDEFSGRYEPQLANERELSYLFDRRRLVLERREGLIRRARNRYDALADTTNLDLGGNRTILGSRMELAVIPRFPTMPLCRQEDLVHLVRYNSLSWRQARLPNIENEIITQHESALILRAAHEDYSIFETNVWGLLFYGTRIDENLGSLITGEPDPNEPTGIHMPQFTGFLLAFVHHARAMLNAMRYTGPLELRLWLNSIRHVEWLEFYQGIPARKLGSELDDSVDFSISSSIEELSDKTNDVVSNLLRYSLFAVNAAEHAQSQATLDSLIQHGYRFNTWSR
jgi:hypothetical protein